jgi:hypothetical protein
VAAQQAVAFVAKAGAGAARRARLAGRRVVVRRRRRHRTAAEARRGAAVRQPQQAHLRHAAPKLLACILRIRQQLALC